MKSYNDLKKILSEVVQGKQIDIINLPLPITPEQILCCTDQDRIEGNFSSPHQKIGFNKLLNELTEEKKVLTQAERRFSEIIKKNVRLCFITK